MRSKIASYKESLSRIASDVLDAAEDLSEEPGSQPTRDSPSVDRDRRMSHRLAQSASPVRYPASSNGAGSGATKEVDQNEAEIERLRASEAEIKALAVNYAAILKEKEGELSRLHEENSLLKQSLEARKGITQGTNNQPPSRAQHRNGVQGSPRSPVNNLQKSTISRQDSFGNGGSQALQSGKDLESLLEEKTRALATVQAGYESEVKQLQKQLENERAISADLKIKFQDEKRMNGSSHKENYDLKSENSKIAAAMQELQKTLEMKTSEIARLEEELNKRNNDELDKSLSSLRIRVARLEEENAKLKIEKEELKASMELRVNENGENAGFDNFEYTEAFGNLKKEKDDMKAIIHQLEKTLDNTRKEREKAQRELARLKQHLLDKELEESEKMDEDSKIIEELRTASEQQKVHILRLEKALKQELAKQEEFKNVKSIELQKSSEIINNLNQKLASYASIVESKNTELLNLQTALGQYYVESEAKERLERDLAAARKESSKLSDLLKISAQDLEISRKEKDEAFSKLAQAERVLLESKSTIQKLKEDNSKLHRAVEQSMTRINRMSMDSDFYVDRRIVIKLLVTYFQRNHSKEVLDLMVRMLGFSDEDKQRIGFAQHAAGRTAVRGVLGLPGRLVGGILGARTSEVPPETHTDNQSFADLWVDFLLKETEQKERRESVQGVGTSSNASERNPDTGGFSPIPGSASPSSNFSTEHSSINRFSSPLPRQDYMFESDSEFATVPLSSSVSSTNEQNSRFSKAFPKY